MADIDDDTDEEAFGITDRLVGDVMAAVAAGQGDVLSALLDHLHPADVAHLLEQVDARDRRDLLRLGQVGLTVKSFLNLTKTCVKRSSRS